MNDVLDETGSSVAFAFDLTREALEHLIPEGLAVLCIDGDPEVIADAGAQRLGPLALRLEGAVVDPGTLFIIADAIDGWLSRTSPIAEWLVRLRGPEIRHYLARPTVHAVDWLIAIVDAARVASPGHERIHLTPEWPAYHLPSVLRAIADPSVASVIDAHLEPDLARRLRAVRMPGVAVSRLRLAASACKTILIPWLAVFRRAGVRSTRFPASRVVLRTYPTDWDAIPEEAGRIRRADFVVDDDELRRSDVIVWADVGVSEARKARLRERGYTVAEKASVRIGPWTLLTHALPRLAAWTLQLPALLRGDRWWYENARMLVSDAIVWPVVARGLGRTTFLAYNDIGADAVSRNLVFRREQVSTVSYQHSSALYGEFDGRWSYNIVCANLVVDVLALWGDAAIAQYRMQPGSVGGYWKVGCLWSELVRWIVADPALTSRYRASIEAAIGRRLGDFERTVALADATITSEESLRSWLDFHWSFARLARELPRVHFLVKTKWEMDETLRRTGEEGEALFAAFAELPNVSVVPQELETSAVVAFSDAVVGMPFTSVVFEALGVGKRTCYYDPTDMFPNANWREIPGMVVHGEDALSARLRSLLFEITDEEYAEYLRAELSGVEGFFDGFAITRLRRLILQ